MKWYAICEHKATDQTAQIVNNKGADQPGYLGSLINVLVVCCLDSIPLLAKVEISRPELVSVAERAGLCLTWSQTPKTGFLVMRLNYMPCKNSSHEQQVHSLNSLCCLLMKLESLATHTDWSDCVDAHAGQMLSLMRMSFCRFCYMLGSVMHLVGWLWLLLSKLVAQHLCLTKRQ